MTRTWLCVLLLAAGLAQAAEPETRKPEPKKPAPAKAAPTPAKTGAESVKAAPAPAKTGAEPAKAAPAKAASEPAKAEPAKSETEPAQAEPAGKPAEAETKPKEGDKDDPNLGMSILGNQEAPKSLVIVPWKSSEIGNSVGIATMLDDSRQPIDKEVFMRVLSYYELTVTTTHRRKP